MGILKKIFSKNLKEIIKISAILSVSIALVIFIITSMENSYWSLDLELILVFLVSALSLTFLISLNWLLLKWYFKFVLAVFRALFTATGKTPPAWLQESIDENPTAKQEKVVGGMSKCPTCDAFFCECNEA
jgi:hypothetical protein